MRRYSIRCDGFDVSHLRGGFSFSAYEAGTKWAAEHLPGYETCFAHYHRTYDSETEGLYALWIMEAYCPEIGKGVQIYIQEML